MSGVVLIVGEVFQGF